MADTPMAIRASDETKALFADLAERGNFENKGEFLGRLLAMYQAEQVKGGAPLLRPAIEAVEELTRRLFDVLNGAGAAVETRAEQHARELAEQKASSEETRALLQRRIAALERERDEGRLRGEAADGLAGEVERLRRENGELRLEARRQAEAAQLQKDRELLELRQRLQARAEEQQERYATLVAEYEGRVRGLLSPEPGQRKPPARKGAARQAQEAPPQEAPADAQAQE